MNDPAYLKDKTNGWFGNAAIILIILIAFAVAIVSIPLKIITGGGKVLRGRNEIEERSTGMKEQAQKRVREEVRKFRNDPSRSASVSSEEPHSFSLPLTEVI